MGGQLYWKNEEREEVSAAGMPLSTISQKRGSKNIWGK